MENNKHCWK